MANFVAVVDSNPERRSQFIKTITPMLPPVDGLLTYLCESGNFVMVWAASPIAPVSYETDAAGAGVLLGEAIAPYSSDRMTATNIREKWQGADPSIFASFDGFYVAIAYHPERGLTVGADILGLFPVYYYQRGEVLLVASSPELLQYHPCFHRQFNPAGLVGILLTNGLVDGQTLWSGVYRLGAGCLLVAAPDKPVKEVTQYSIPRSLPYDKYSALSHAEQLDALDNALNQAIDHQMIATESYVLMLSGGLDSRLLAGYLHRQNINTVALTLGKQSDLEMQCAVGVTRTLGLPHHTYQAQFDRYLEYAHLCAKWEHLTNGFSIVFDDFNDNLHLLGHRITAGLSLDLIMGGPQPDRLFLKPVSFDTFFRRGVNGWGLSPEILKTLLRREVFADLVQDRLARMQAIYNDYSDIEFRRAGQFKLNHRQRFHVGASAWRLSFKAWSTLPILDRQLLEVCAAIPAETIDGRKAQRQLLCDRFPHLARLPIDRNSHNIEPLKPSPTRQRLAPLFQMQRRWWGLQRRLGYERRYYYRVLNSDNAGWRAIRGNAESQRDKVQHLFHKDVLDQLLPAPHAALELKRDAITGASGIKTLIGFLLWSADHL
ncbi:MAG: asparagine synthase-related protein [Oculatellaceae cyanobacterium bins.114]|nr:asparagine synthase-related protein [Oculatellaceae cyanobacterium bins.114]